MAVVTKYGRSYKDPTATLLIDPVFSEGRPRQVNSGAVAVANGDSATSKHYLGKIASNAVPSPLGILYHDALTGVTSYDIGLELNGAAVNVNCFAAALNLTVAGSKAMLAAVATANLGKRVWELLGLASDPGVEYDIIGTMNQAATAAGSLAGFFIYSRK